MSKIDINNWKEFKVGDLFNIHSTKKKFNAKKLYFDGKYPYVARGQFSNGIRGYIDEDPQYLNPANTISFGQDTATMYYQPQPYFTGDKIQIFELNDKYPKLNEKTAQFLIACMHVAFSMYSWGVQSFAVAKLKNTSLKLPVTSSGEPDWVYMNKCITKLTAQTRKNAKILNALKSKKHKLNINEWKDFHLYDLFDIDSGSKLDHKDINQVPGDQLNYIGRTSENNGIIGTCDPIYDKQYYEPGCLTLALGGRYLGSTFIQHKKFYTGQNVAVLIPKKEMSDNVKYFIASCIYKESQNNYIAFAKELNAHIKTDFHFPLPVTTNGDPDFDYMDKYIDNMKSKAKQNIQLMKSI